MREREHEKRTRRTWGAARDVRVAVDDDEINDERGGKENGKERGGKDQPRKGRRGEKQKTR